MSALLATNLVVLLLTNPTNVVYDNLYVSTDGVSETYLDTFNPVTNISFTPLPGTNQYAVMAADWLGNPSAFSDWIQYPPTEAKTNIVLVWSTNGISIETTFSLAHPSWSMLYVPQDTNALSVPITSSNQWFRGTQSLTVH